MNSPDATTGFELARQGRLADALPYLEQANRAAPADVPLLHACASVLQSAGRMADAVERYQRAAALLPDNIEVLSGWGRALLLSGEYGKALPLFDRALTLDPGYADDGRLFATLLWEADDADLACDVLKPLLDRRPEHTGLLRQYAHALEVAERLPEAQAAFERYKALRPEDPAVYVELGKLASMRGDANAAQEHFNAALAIDPQRASALWAITQTGKGPLDPETLARMHELAQTEPDIDHSLALHYAQARHHESLGEFQVAQTHIARVNALQAELVPQHKRYSEEKHALDIDNLIRAYTPQLFEYLGHVGNPTRRPVFIIGLPRSGTTLLERMLASHPSIVGVGEQSLAHKSLQRALIESGGTLTPAAIDAAARWHLQTLEDRVQRLEIRGSGERIVDKMPDNYMFAGWLRIAFPNAAIIHCLRDPRDVALSCWQTQFSKIGWSHDLEHIAHRIEQHRRLMRHWRATIGDHLTEIRYEPLVDDPETELRRALAAIGLEWHPDMLDFAERDGIVRTASLQQVRQPLHGRSVGRWRDYEEALQPILPRLNAVAAQDALEADSVGES
jgi:tetratricopeptide (TPR) repeat protein